MGIDWKHVIEHHGGIWVHDGNPQRPYAQLTSRLSGEPGRISDTYADGSVIVMEPRLIALAAEHLVQLLWKMDPEIFGKKLIVIGQMEGSTFLASRIAELFETTFIYTNKSSDGQKMQIAPRFQHQDLPLDAIVLMVEDVLTGGVTTHASMMAVIKHGFERFIPAILTLADRTEHGRTGILPILSCAKIHGGKVWEHGDNPHTKDTNDGEELVPPVLPKGPDAHLLWAKMS